MSHVVGGVSGAIFGGIVRGILSGTYPTCGVMSAKTRYGVAALKGCVQAGDWVGHGRTPESDCAQHPRVGRWTQDPLPSHG